ncbi:MAG: hypothetical protein ABL891_01400 [Burkholderiales bacterium]
MTTAAMMRSDKAITLARLLHGTNSDTFTSHFMVCEPAQKGRAPYGFNAASVARGNR